MRDAVKASSGRIMASLDDAWSRTCSIIRDLGIVCIPVVLDRPVRSVVLDGFRGTVLADVDIRRSFTEAMIATINELRNDCIETEVVAIEKAQAKRLLDMLAFTGESFFEQPFLDASRAFYRSSSPIGSDVAEYLVYVRGRLSFEETLVSTLFPPGILRPLLHTLEQVLIGERLSAILAGAAVLFTSDNAATLLALLYNLVHRVDQLDALRQAWFALLKQTGSALVLDKTREATLVVDLLALRDRVAAIHEAIIWAHPQASNSSEATRQEGEAVDQGMLTSAKEAFEHFVNLRGNRPAELLAHHVDQLLRQSTRQSSHGEGDKGEDDLDASLDRLLVLFRYLHAKDVFEAFYKRDLARRLLTGRHAAMDVERGMLRRMQVECGSGFTSRMEGMFRDVDISKELVAAFHQQQQSKGKRKEQQPLLDINAMIITSGIWPHPPSIDIALPPEVEKAQKAFASFYLAQHRGRRLAWNQHLGHCLLRASYPSGEKELVLSVLQACVLLQFSTSDGPLTFRELQSTLGTDEVVLARTLQSLCTAKMPLLTKAPAERNEVRANDCFAFNVDFSSPLYRLKVNSVVPSAARADASEGLVAMAVDEEVALDRQHQLDAAIVRTLKRQKSCTTSALHAVLQAELGFPFKQADVEERIRALVERDFLAQSTEDEQVYTYVA